MSLRNPRPRALSLLPLASALVCTLGAAACGDDGPATTEDTTEDTADTAEDTLPGPDAGPDTTPDTGADTIAPPPEVDAVFRAGMSPGQGVTAGPFPNDTLRDPDGSVRIAPLADDPAFTGLARRNQLERFDALIPTRGGFSFTSAAFFPMDAPPDLGSFDGKVEYLSLAGLDAGARFPAQVGWFPQADLLVTLPAWGHAMMPGSTYAILIHSGVRDADGRLLEAPAAILEALSADATGASPDGARAHGDPSWTLLRDGLPSGAELVMATTFTTEESLPWLESLLEAAGTFPLEQITARVGTRDPDSADWILGGDLEGDALQAYMGEPEAPFAHMPTHWTTGHRAEAASLPDADGPYEGGAFYGRVARVTHGGLVMPSFNLVPDGGRVVPTGVARDAGVPTARARTLVPFTTYLCEDHVASADKGLPIEPRGIPVAVFTHGGTETRSQALPFAASNCEQGIATVVLDLPFHGGRGQQRYLADADLIVPVPVDAYNAHNGAAEADWVGDPPDSTISVGGLFGVPSSFDPEVIEINLATIAIETHTLLRYLRDDGPNGLGAFLGVTIDAERVMMQSLSFGSNFTVANWATDPSISHIVTSVASGYILSVNLPMAPANTQLVGFVLQSTLGLANPPSFLAAGAWRDPAVALLQWLCQRGDPLAYAPYVLRHRQDGHAPQILATGNSWDETLFGPAQISFNNALGLPVYADAAADWRLDPAMPGAETVSAEPFPTGPLKDNLELGERVTTAALFYHDASCHPHITAPLCASRFERDYPPPTARSAPLVFDSFICEVHDLVVAFAASFADSGADTELWAPRGASCTSVYAPR